MTIEKKSLISTLKTAKKANVAKDDLTGAATVSPAQKLPIVKAAATVKLGVKATKRAAFKGNLAKKAAAKIS